MKFLGMEKVRDGKYLKNYELSYENKAGRLKKFEIVSRKELNGPEDLGRRTSGVSIVAFHEGKMLLLEEFRLSINKKIFNLCAGMLEPGETIEECVRRELYEETGLSVKRFLRILPPSYSAVGFSDTKTYIAFVEAEGAFADHTSDNEEITARFYGKEELQRLLDTAEFSSRSQMAAFFFCEGIVETPKK
ncbi:MAG: NUDIX hydrolase [Eubacteriales bacterium]|nr:NUDIX hydrolase [Eubacteriales bacterium]